ncbi:MAG: FadR family transcriptional regulator [Nocardioidaceae bacterium]|nr:MAG: FadR family transcriptional regulator [Nocardioidaceae bacterium]
MAHRLELSHIRPVKTMAAHELVLEQIRTAILVGRYGPGDKLPRERDLAEMLQVSRTTVREAIAVLTSDGLIQVKRGRSGGLIVRATELDETVIRESLRTNRQKLDEVFEFRKVVEGASARIAAEKRTAADLIRLRSILTTMDEIVGGEVGHGQDIVARFMALDHEFHAQIALASRNPWLADATIAARIEMFRPVGGVFRRLEPSAHTAHHHVLEAIEAQDGAAAERWMTSHIDETWAVIDSWLEGKRRVKVTPPPEGRREDRQEEGRQESGRLSAIASQLGAGRSPRIRR